jgi:predicted S18 family serine protease
MENHSTRDPVAYFNALNDEQAALDDALAAIRAEQAEGRLTVAEAAAERAGLLERHLERLAALRAQYLGES